MILIYNILFFCMAVFGFPLILPVIFTSGKRRKTFVRRLGLGRSANPAGLRGGAARRSKRIWVHALSVGEVLSAITLIKGLKNKMRGDDIFLSVSTLTGFCVANRHLKNIVKTVFFCPYDFVFSVRRIVRQVNPALVLIVETDIWPNFLNEITKRRVPILLINARLSKKSFSGYKKFSIFTRWMFLNFSKICAQSRRDEERFKNLGIPSARVTVTGNIKFDQMDEPVSPEQIRQKQLRLNFASRKKIFLAGSTHEGEESLMLKVYTKLRKNNIDITLIVAPRDQRRARAVGRLFHEAGISAVCLTKLSEAEGDKSNPVIIVDTIGELRELYALADIAFVGGSLVNCGGHNPLEPAAFSKPILFGPDMSDFAEISGLLIAAGGARRVESASELFNAVIMLIENGHMARDMGRRAFDMFCQNKGAVERNLKVIAEVLEEKHGSGMDRDAGTKFK